MRFTTKEKQLIESYIGKIIEARNIPQPATEVIDEITNVVTGYCESQSKNSLVIKVTPSKLPSQGKAGLFNLNITYERISK